MATTSRRGGRHRSAWTAVFVALVALPSASASSIVSVPLRRTPSAGLRASLRAGHRHRRGASFLSRRTPLVHAIDYVGEVAIGTPPRRFRVIFDTGSGNLLVASTQCNTSAACRNHHLYNASASITSLQVGWLDNATAPPSAASDRDIRHVAFGTGEAWAQLARDRVCLGSLCTTANFLEAIEESDKPFLTAHWDAVLGLAPDISVAKEYNIFAALRAAHVLPQPVFAFFLGSRLEDEAEVMFGGYQPERLAAPLDWVNLSSVGYWQISLQDLVVGGHPLELGCGCKGCCQAVLDSGSSLMMGPAFVINLLQKKLNVTEECTNKTFPTLGFSIRTRDGQNRTLTMEPEDYMDREVEKGTDYCWAHLMPMEDPGRGPVFVLGMPFLRKFYTVFDSANHAVGFGLAKQRASSSGFERAATGAARSNRKTSLPRDVHAQDQRSENRATANDNRATSENGKPGLNASTLPLLPCRGDCPKTSNTSGLSA